MITDYRTWLPDTMDLSHYLRIQAHANHLMNQRLARAMQGLAAPEIQAPRVGFFPSLAATLGHILEVDLFYVAVLEGDAHARQVFETFRNPESLAEWDAAQRAVDQRLIAFCAGLDAAGCDAAVHIPRADHVQVDRVAHLLAHLFMHQTHHRGQVHAMLSSTAVAPPQLDEFMMPSEAHLREADMAALGWEEAAVYRPCY
ncbi:MAG: DinB family protein [Inhella sp.]